MKRMHSKQEIEQIAQEAVQVGTKLYKHELTFDIGEAGGDLTADDWKITIVNLDNSNYSLTLTEEVMIELAGGEVPVIEASKLISPYYIVSNEAESATILCSTLSISANGSFLAIGDIMNALDVAEAEDEDFQNLEGFQIIDTVTEL